jgi:GAF domain-containing protein
MTDKPLPDDPGSQIQDMQDQIEKLQAEKTQALQKMEERLAELLTLNAISQAATAETSLPDFYRIIHQEIKVVMGDVHLIIARYYPDQNQIEIPYAYEGGEILHIDPFPLGEGLTSILIRTRQPLMLVDDTENKARALGAKLVGMPAKSWLGVPMMVVGEVIGALIVQDSEHEHRFDENDQRLLITLAGQIAIAIRNLQLLEDTRRRADREKILANVISQAWASSDLETILKSTLLELSKSLQVTTGRISIEAPFITNQADSFSMPRQ